MPDQRSLFLISNVLFALILSVRLASSPVGAAIGPLGEAPGIVRTNPGENQSEVDPAAFIIVEFSKQIDPRSLTPETFQVEGEEGIVHYDAETKSATWRSILPLAPGRQYQVAVTSEITDLEGRHLPFSYRWTFTTRSGEETLLTIQQITPPDKAVHVPVNTPISVTFNKPIDPASLQPDSIAVIDEGKVAGHLDYDPASRTVTFSPASSLAYEQGYTVILKEGIQDSAGNRLSMAKSWSFTTEAPPLPVSTLDP